MKGPRVSLISSMLLMVTIAICSILQYHHHAADGSVCICLHLDCCGHSDAEHHHNSCQHQHEDEGTCSDCGIQIDEFCCKDNLRVKLLSSYFSLQYLVASQLEISEPSSQTSCEYIVFDARRPKIYDISVSGMRAPPVVDALKV